MVASDIGAQPAKLARRPNLVVFLPDQQRSDTISCYGAPRPFAPSLDKLASQSCIFQRAYVSQPLCTPSRSCLMSGTWPHANGCLHNNLPLPNELQCLPEMIADRDYRFGYMGKWHLGDEVLAQHGFDEWTSIISGRDVNLVDGHRHGRILSDYENFLRSHNLEPDDRARGVFTSRFESRLPLELSKPKFLEAKTCDFLERNRRKPFVLFVAFFEPHPPYNGPLNGEHPPNELELDPTVDHVFGPDMPLRYRLRQEWLKKRYGSKHDEILATKSKYLGLVTEIDKTIGVVLTKLEQLGLADDTIVMHTSDHGDMMGALGLFGKGVMFEGAARVPWLIRLPGQQKPISIAQPVSQIDFAPTIVDLLGKPRHPQCVGKSLGPLLHEQRLPTENIFVEWHPAQKGRVMKRTRLAAAAEIKHAMNESTRAVISPDGWKLCLRDRDSNELYNLNSDPREQTNLFATAPKEILSRLTGDIHRWQETVGDKLKV